jgi:GNAT superfamily N-acetyltransferase
VYARWVVGAIARGTYVGWLAEASGEVVGGAGLVLLDWGPTRRDPNPIRGRIANVYTEPSWRRRGVARALVGQCINEAETRGIGVISLSTTLAARTLYAQLGFRAAEGQMVKESGQ